MAESGICYIVGAGPGDPGLLTLKGAECLRRADIVYYDYLSSDELLSLAPAESEKFYVGKKAGCHSVPQDETGRRLCDAVRAGKTVVRLKGGDPFVFGRGGEEALALAAEGLPFEIVPGVSSGIAAPAYAGIPVTHRAIATGVTFVTGHETPDKDDQQIDWKALAALNHTLCIYMGIGRMREICSALIEYGRRPDEPAAAIRWGTTVKQECVSATLLTLADEVEKAGLKPPALIVIGDVVALRERIGWFEKKPLFGKKILVTRARTQASGLVHKLRELGAEAVELPTIRIEEVEASECDTLTSSILKMKNRSGWVVFTSANGVEHVWRRIGSLSLDARIFGNLRVAAIGPGTSKELEKYGIVPDLIPEKFVGESLFDALKEKCGGELRGVEFLLLRSDLAREDLREQLVGGGASVDEVTAYHTVNESEVAPETVESLENCSIDAITFASSSSARNFSSLLGNRLKALVDGGKRPLFISIGPITSAAMKECGLPVDAEAMEYTIPGLLAALEQALKIKK
ncbi:MAG: uroporphyrinogen-III C-methyltransferase [Planctomycetes bacterium]|nr:uroporphyrinogen-III C-methyltransferase [Planctomycetota bacterium]